MKVFKYMILGFMVLIVVSVSYLGIALHSSSWYEDINMETQYSVSHYLTRINEITQQFTVDPLEVTTFSLSEKECEGFLKLAVGMNKDIIATIQGLGLEIQQSSIIIKTNFQIVSQKKGLEITIKPYAEEKERELALKVEKIKLGDFPLPVVPVLYIAEKAVPEDVPIKIENGRVRLNINNMPVALKYVKIEPQQLIAGLSMATVELTDMSNEDIVLIHEVFEKAEVLQTGLASAQVKDFITEMQEKEEILSEDIDKAKAIYNSLSSEDKKVLQHNLNEFLRDPEVSEALKRFGLQ